jgi:serine/threonine protein phosphatase PrpC
LPLSFDQIPTNLPGATNRRSQGKSERRIDGDLAVSRAFGDYSFKEDASLAADKQRLVVPELVYPRIMDKDEFIILACDGIWDVASSNQCSQFVQGLLLEGETDLGNIAEEALDTCLERKSSDNMTMMIIGLPASTQQSVQLLRDKRCLGAKEFKKGSAVSATKADKTTRDVTFRGLRFYFNVFLQCVDEMNIDTEVLRLINM